MNPGNGAPEGSLVPVRTVARLSQYRRVLDRLLDEGHRQVFSHQIAALAGGSAAQVRRDLMLVGCRGRPSKGYDAYGLKGCIEELLQAPGGQRVALVGLGNLGRAILPFFARYRPALRIVAVFDNDPRKIGEKLVEGCSPCQGMEELEQTVRQSGITIGVLTVPPGAAQGAADELIAAGVRGLVNFAPVVLEVPEGVFVEDIDLTTALEKAAYFAHHAGKPAEGGA
jgi:redox-sensing transcriptional repressor